MCAVNSFRSATVLLVFLAFLSAPLLVSVALAAEEKSWTTLEPMPTKRFSLGVAVVDGKIYAIGGTNGTHRFNVNEMYDPVTNTWHTKALLPTPRYDFGIAVVENKIYCIGGSTGDWEYTGVNEVYDPATDTWETKTSMPTRRNGINANVVDGKIYIIGGSGARYPASESLLDVNEVYDVATDTWETKKPIPTGVNDYASAVVDNRIYIMGGAVEVTLNQIYDPETDTWSSGVPLPAGVDSASAGATTGELALKRIYVIGGKQNLDAVNLTQIYDPATDTWVSGPAMLTARYGLGVAVINDVLYAIGGIEGWIVYPVSAANEQYIPADYIGKFYSQSFDAGTWEDTQYDVFVVSNSTVSDFGFDADGARVLFKIEGEPETRGFCNVTIPKNLLDAENTWTVLVDGISVTPIVNKEGNYTTLHFTYSHSTKAVEIIGTDAIPEFPSWTPTLLILIVLAVTVAIYKRKLTRKPN